jgi:AraC-like DNA-binding protein
MQPIVFSTAGIAPAKQLDAWRSWFDPVFEAEVADPEQGFLASSETWNFSGFGLSRVRAPKLRAVRTPELIRRNPVDHWVVTIGNARTVGQAGPDQSMDIPARLPFIASLGRTVVSARDADERLQFYLPRDSFPELGAILEKAEGRPVDGPLGALLADFMVLLSRSASAVTGAEMPHLSLATRGLLRACIMPSVGDETDPLTSAPLTIIRMQRVTRLVDAHLHAPSLGPAMICQLAGMSRSQLYRLLEGEGGVRHFIQRRRLRRCCAELSHASEDRSIWAIAMRLGFHDPSSFSRSFKKEFGTTPREFRDAARIGLSTHVLGTEASALQDPTLRDLLQSMRPV